MAPQEKPSAKKSSHLNLFLRSSIFDYVLVLVVAAALTFTVSFAFYSASGLRSNIVFTVVITAILLVPLYAGAWSKRALTPAIIGYIVLAIAVIAGISFMAPESTELFVDGQINDTDSNYAIYGIVVVVVPVLVYLLSRRTWGVAVLLFAVALACGSVQFLYRDWISTQPGTAAAILAFAGTGALFVVQGYRQGVLRARHVKRTAFGASFLFGVGLAALCSALAVGLYFLIIPNLGLSTIDIKPFQDYYQRPVIEYDGTYEQELVIDPNLGTSAVNEDMQDTSSDAQGKAAEDESSEAGGGFSVSQLVIDTLNPDNWQEALDAIRYDLPLSLKFLLAFIPIALIVAAILLRRSVRNRRLVKMATRPFDERVVILYDFFLKRFKRLKIDKSPSATPLEFALDSSSELAPFVRNDSKTNFLDITLIYQRACYGAHNVSAADYAQCEDYYRAFFKNAKSRMSGLKWAFWGFWRI